MLAAAAFAAAVFAASWFELGGGIDRYQATGLTPITTTGLAALDDAPPRLTFGDLVVPIQVLQGPGFEQDGARRVMYLDPAFFHCLATLAARHHVSMPESCVEYVSLMARTRPQKSRFWLFGRRQHPQAEIVKMCIGDCCRRIRERVAARLGLGEGDDFANVGLAKQ